MKKLISGLGDLQTNYDLFLIDQFGVLHDGRSAYPNAIETLETLKSFNKRVVILSNSGKRAAVNQHRLATLGFTSHHYDNLVTSGEVAFHQLQAAFQGSVSKACYLFSRDNDNSSIAELPVEQVYQLEEADFILISGCEPEKFTENDYRKLLEPSARERKLCFCTNPDKKMLLQGHVQFGAGRIAEIYEELGGQVRWIGKPFSSMYKHSLSLHPSIKTERVVCIGDSIEHDIVGGSKAKLDTILVLTGILENTQSTQLEGLFRRYQVQPDFILKKLKV